MGTRTNEPVAKLVCTPWHTDYCLGHFVPRHPSKARLNVYHNQRADVLAGSAYGSVHGIAAAFHCVFQLTLHQESCTHNFRSSSTFAVGSTQAPGFPRQPRGEVRVPGNDGERAVALAGIKHRHRPRRAPVRRLKRNKPGRGRRGQQDGRPVGADGSRGVQVHLGFPSGCARA